MFEAYSLYNADRDKLYIGHTSNIRKRIKRHNGLLKSKSSSFTRRNSGTWDLVYSEKFKTREEAKVREKQLKSYQGRKFIRNIIKSKNMRR